MFIFVNLLTYNHIQRQSRATLIMKHEYQSGARNSSINNYLRTVHNILSVGQHQQVHLSHMDSIYNRYLINPCWEIKPQHTLSQMNFHGSRDPVFGLCCTHFGSSFCKIVSSSEGCPHRNHDGCLNFFIGLNTMSQA